MSGKRRVIVGDTRVCSKDYGVTTVTTSGGDKFVHRKSPCEQCPWREDVPTGVFPAEAFRESAHTAYDMSLSTFACHMAGPSTPATCAGFLLRHSENNLQIRMSRMLGRFDDNGLNDGGFPIYLTYREMAIANGVNLADAVLSPIRGNEESR